MCIWAMGVEESNHRVTMTFVLPDRPIQPSFRLAREGGVHQSMAAPAYR
jgi:hypothetical protein